VNLTSDDNDFLPDSENVPLTITSHSYGGCEMGGCASYRIEEDGSFTYIVRPRNAPEIRTEGKLVSEEKKALQKLIKDTNLDSLVDTRFSGTCPIAFDGIAFKYTITFDQKHLTFDSCQQELRNIPLFEILSRYFGIFQNWNKNT
jgi:hypothetical protein